MVDDDLRVLDRDGVQGGRNAQSTIPASTNLLRWDISTVAYGVLPPKFFEILKARLLQAAQARRTRTVLRTD